MKIDVPDDLLQDVARALERQADLYRSDKGHAPEDIAVLMADADRLDTLAAEIEFQYRRIVADRYAINAREERK